MSFNYISPIQLIMDDFQTAVENEITKVIQNLKINVDTDELEKALKYDRKQYEKGFIDGQERKHAKYIGWWSQSCSECGSPRPIEADGIKIDKDEVRFCYYCGAKIDREEVEQ